MLCELSVNYANLSLQSSVIYNNSNLFVSRNRIKLFVLKSVSRHNTLISNSLFDTDTSSTLFEQNTNLTLQCIRRFWQNNQYYVNSNSKTTGDNNPFEHKSYYLFSVPKRLRIILNHQQVHKYYTSRLPNVKPRLSISYYDSHTHTYYVITDLKLEQLRTISGCEYFNLHVSKSQRIFTRNRSVLILSGFVIVEICLLKKILKLVILLNFQNIRDSITADFDINHEYVSDEYDQIASYVSHINHLRVNPYSLNSTLTSYQLLRRRANSLLINNIDDNALYSATEFSRCTSTAFGLARRTTDIVQQTDQHNFSNGQYINSQNRYQIHDSIAHEYHDCVIDATKVISLRYIYVTLLIVYTTCVTIDFLLSSLTHVLLIIPNAITSIVRSISFILLLIYSVNISIITSTGCLIARKSLSQVEISFIVSFSILLFIGYLLAIIVPEYPILLLTTAFLIECNIILHSRRFLRVLQYKIATIAQTLTHKQTEFLKYSSEAKSSYNNTINSEQNNSSPNINFDSLQQDIRKLTNNLTILIQMQWRSRINAVVVLLFLFSQSCLITFSLKALRHYYFYNAAQLIIFFVHYLWINNLLNFSSCTPLNAFNNKFTKLRSTKFAYYNSIDDYFNSNSTFNKVYFIFKSESSDLHLLEMRTSRSFKCKVSSFFKKFFEGVFLNTGNIDEQWDETGNNNIDVCLFRVIFLYPIII